MSKRRWPRLVSVLTVMALLLSLLPASLAVAAAADYSTAATVSAASVPAGQSIGITALVTGAVAETVNIVVDVMDPVSRRVHEQWFEAQTFTPGETKQFPITFTPALDGLVGNYRVRVLIFNDRKTSLYVVNSEAAAFSVTKPQQDLFTATVTASPSPIEVGTGTVQVSATVTSATTKGLTIGVDVYDPVSRKVVERFFDNQSFTAGQPLNFDLEWAVPEEALPGQYRIRVLVMTPDRVHLYKVLDSVGTFEVTPHPDPYATTATVDRSTLAPGETVNITAEITALESIDTLVHLFVYHQDGRVVHQKVYDNQHLPAGETMRFPTSWEVWAGDPGGTYTVKIGIFNPGWGTLYWWNDNAMQFTVDSPVAYTSAATAPAEAVKTGTTAHVTASITAAAATDNLVHLFVYGPSGLAFQQVYDNQHFNAGETREYNLDWFIPTGGMVGEYTVKIGLFNPGWGHLYHWNDRAATFTVIAGSGTSGPSTEPGPVPTQDDRLPGHLGIGLAAYNSPRGITGWMPETGVPWNYAYQYLAGGVNTGNGWAHWNPNGTFALSYAHAADQQGYIPVFTYYQMFHTMGACDGCSEPQRDLSNLNSQQVMAQYYADFALLMKRLGSASHDGISGFGKTAIVHVEPDLSGYANHAVLGANHCFGFCTASGNDPSLLNAAVASTGMPELAGLPDTWLGFNLALLKLRDTYAPNVLLAFHISNWATLQDVGGNTNPNLDVAALGRSAGEFAALSGVRHSADGISTYDLVFNDVSDRDAGFYKYVLGRQNAFWDRHNVTLPNFHNWEAFLGAALRVAGKPAMVWQIPLGNQVYRTMDNTRGHYQDNKAEYFFGHIEELARLGIVGLLFGSGEDRQTTQFDNLGDGITNPAPTCTTDGTSSGQVCNDQESLYADDDGGYLRLTAGEYYKAPYVLPH